MIEFIYSGPGNDTITGDADYNNAHGEDGADNIDVSGDLQSDFVSCGGNPTTGDGVTDTVKVDSTDTGAADYGSDDVTIV